MAAATMLYDVVRSACVEHVLWHPQQVVINTWTVEGLNMLNTELNIHKFGGPIGIQSLTYDGYTYQKWWFSIVTLVYQRVYHVQMGKNDGFP